MRECNLLLLLAVVIVCHRECHAAPEPPPFQQPDNRNTPEQAALDLQATAIVSIARLQAAVVELEPFPHLVVPGFVTPRGLQAANVQFPLRYIGFHPEGAPEESLRKRGRLPQQLQPLITKMRSRLLRDILGSKLNVSLAGTRPWVTVSGVCSTHEAPCSGAVRTDHTYSRLSATVYLNTVAPASPTPASLLLLDAPDVFRTKREVPAWNGTLVAWPHSAGAWFAHRLDPGDPLRRIRVNYEHINHKAHRLRGVGDVYAGMSRRKPAGRASKAKPHPSKAKVKPMRATTAKPVPPLPTPSAAKAAAALPKLSVALAGDRRSIGAPPRNSVQARRMSNYHHVFHNVLHRNVKGQHTAALQWKESHLKTNADVRNAQVDHQLRMLSASSAD